MEIISKSPEKLVIKTELKETILNAIRRSVLEVPTLAIDEVEIYKNDSALYDEMLAHRLGLVALKTEKSMGEKTKVEFKLTKIGPGTVYSGDLKGSADLVYDNVPITLLAEGSKVELSATAVLGKGINHAKFVPGLCYYRHLLEVKSSSEIDKVVQKSKGLIKAEKKGSKWICDLNDSEVNEVLSIDKEAISDSESLLLVVESYGNMPAQDILSKSIEALEENLDEFEKSIK